MRSFLTSIYIMSLLSCAGHPINPTVSNSTLGTPENIRDFLKGTPFTHFLSECRVFDLEGRYVSHAPGDNCVIDPDGSYYSRTLKSLQYVNAEKKTVWLNPVKHTHHQLFHSKVSGNFLAMDSDFENWNGKKTRFDVLLVLNNSGKIIKRFSFYGFFKNHPEILRNQVAGETNWFYRMAKKDTNIFELTHTNTFIELTRKNSDGSIKVTGYISNCTFQNKFYIFDSNLSQIVSVIDLNGRSTHSVSQISDDELLFYRNSTPESSLSSAEVYNLKTNRFTTLYKSNNPYLSASACSSIQLVSPQKLLVSHSQCISSANKADYGLAIELVNLSEQKAFYYPLQKKIPFSGMVLIDGKKFVESNPDL